MKDKQKAKQKHLFTPQQAAEYLRTLADALEKGEVPFGGHELELEGEITLKESFKNKKHGAALKLKLSLSSAAVDQGSDGEPPESPELDQPQTAETEPPAAAQAQAGPDKRPSYKSLKKHLQKAFKALKKVAGSGEMPQAQILADFTSHARLLTTYAGKGDPNFEAFSARLDELEAAVQAGDAPALQAALADLSQMKKTCHQQFK